MKAMEEKILQEGHVLPGNILKVSHFLNHRIDTAFLMEMGTEMARLFENDGVDLVMTIEASGIAVAVAAAASLQVPVVFAKKHKSTNLSGDVYKATVHSYTHDEDYQVVVSKECLSAGHRVLIVDDFLAMGNAINGLMSIIEQSDSQTVGVAVAIEKGFQSGGDTLRAQGVRVESMAIIDSMDENGVKFRPSFS